MGNYHCLCTCSTAPLLLYCPAVAVLSFSLIHPSWQFPTLLPALLHTEEMGRSLLCLVAGLISLLFSSRCSRGTADSSPDADSSLWSKPCSQWKPPRQFGVLPPSLCALMELFPAQPLTGKVPDVAYGHLGNHQILTWLSWPPGCSLQLHPAVGHRCCAAASKVEKRSDTRMKGGCGCLSPCPAGFPSHLKLKPRRLWRK